MSDATPVIDQNDVLAWSHAVVSDDLPELSTTPEWLETMGAARKKKKKLTQKQLGDLVGTSQNIISLIESGEVGSSKFILPICRVLEIEPPQHFAADAMRTWMERGRKLHETDPRRFAELLRFVEGMTEEDAKDEKKAPASQASKGAKSRSKR